MSALSGSRYVPDFVSGKIDVCHVVVRIVTLTGNDPQLRDFFLYCVFISVDTVFGILTKYHEPAWPAYRNTVVRMVYICFTLRFI